MRFWQQLQDLYQPLSVRERGLILAALLALLMLGGYTLMVEPAVKARRLHLAQMAELQRQAADQAQQLALLQSQLRVDPRAQVEKILEELDQQRQLLDEQLSAQTIDLVAPQDMARALRDALASAGGARLVELTTLPVEPLMVSSGEVEKASPDAQGPVPTLYRHPLRLTLSGGYFEARALVQAIEALPWRFYWRELDYSVVEYPRGTLAIELYTLSSSRDWLKGG